MIPNWLTGFPYSVMHSLNLDWLLKKVNSIDPSKFVQSVNNDFKPDPETGNLTLGALNIGALPENGTAVNSNKLAGFDPGYYRTADNILDNTFFAGSYIDGVKEGLVYQAGFNALHGAIKYPFDRWLTYGEDVVINDGYVQIVSVIDQVIDPNSIDPRAMYTAALWLYNGDVIIRTGILENGFGEYATIYAGKSSGTGKYYVRIGGGQNVKYCALYKGLYPTEAVLPHYVRKPFAVELAACRYRYMELNLTSYEKFAFGESFGAGFCDFIIPLGNMAPGNATVTFPETGLYIDGSIALNATPIKTTVYGSMMFLQLNDPQFTVGNHNIGTEDTTAKIAISRDL